MDQCPMSTSSNESFVAYGSNEVILFKNKCNTYMKVNGSVHSWQNTGSWLRLSREPFLMLMRPVDEITRLQFLIEKGVDPFSLPIMVPLYADDEVVSNWRRG